jgi:hypothetical protein
LFLHEQMKDIIIIIKSCSSRVFFLFLQEQIKGIIISMEVSFLFFCFV